MFNRGFEFEGIRIKDYNLYKFDVIAIFDVHFPQEIY